MTSHQQKNWVIMIIYLFFEIKDKDNHDLGNIE